MSASANIRAGAAYVELFVENSALVRGLRAAEKRLKAFGDSVRTLGLTTVGLGTAMLAPLAGAAKSFADLGSRMWDMAGRTGLSVEALSTLGYAAEQSGAGMEAFEGGIRRMQRTIYDAGRGLGTATDALAELGLSVADLENRSPEEQFRLLADRLDRIGDPTRKAATAMAIFGRSGTQLLPMLAGGSAALDAYAKRARDLGLVMSTEDAAAADEFGDVLDDLVKALKMAAFAIGSALAPTFKALAEKTARAAKTVSTWIRENRGAVVSALKVSAAVVAVGAGLTVLGTVISGLGTALGVLASIASAVGTAIGVVGSVIGALLTPVGLISTAVVALGGYLVYASGLGGRALAWLSEQFAWLKDTARTAVKGIGDALAAGDLTLAGRILWLSLKVVFQQGLQSLLGIWLDLKNGIFEVWIALKAGVLKTWQTLWFAVKEIAIRNGIAEPILEGFHLIESGWLKVTQAMGRMWLELVSLVFKAWNRVQSGIASAQQLIGEIAIDVMGYFDQSLDTEGAKKQLREDYAGQQQELADRRSAIDSVTEAERQGLAEQQRGEDAALVARQSERVAELQRQEAIGNRGRVDEMREAQAEVDRQAQAERTVLESKAAADLKASGEALAQARAEWQAAIGEAARKRGAAQAEKRGAGPGGIDDLIRRVQSAAPAVAEASGKAQVQGTFDTVALRALAAAGASDSVAANTAEMVRQQKRTNQKLDEQADIAPAFA